jgi:hypothetical protein
VPARAQESRADQLAALQAEKATRLHPYEPNKLERRLETVDSTLFTTKPLYPFMGTTFDGGGFAVGPGYRGRFGDDGAFDTHAAWSVRNYKAADAMMQLPTFAKGRIGLEMHGSWFDAPNVAFYGIGNETQVNNRGGFSYATKAVGASARVQAAKHVEVGAGVDGIWNEAGPASNNDPIGTANPTYRRTNVFAEYDTRDSRGYSRNGALYRLEWSDYHQTNAGIYSFRRADAEVQRFVPIMRENWVIAMRALVSATDTGAGEQVPYFLLPDMGGTRTLRGYPAWRFRGNDRMILTGEYRWTAGPLVDMALFLDAGRVADRFKDLDLNGLKTTYGIGMSFHTPTATVTRIELARTAEGNSLVFAFSPSF